MATNVGISTWLTSCELQKLDQRIKLKPFNVFKSDKK